MAEWLTLWRQLLRKYGFAGPIWVTEHGYPADPAFQWDPAYRGTDAATGAAAQASLLRRSIRLLGQVGAEQVFVTLRDNLWGEFLSEGIVHIDESQPTYPATRQAGVRRRARPRDQVGSGALHALRVRASRRARPPSSCGSRRPRPRRASRWPPPFRTARPRVIRRLRWSW